MELVLLAAVVAFVALFVVMPAIWSKNPDRRASAIEVLRMILTAFGRRSLTEPLTAVILTQSRL